MTDPAWGELPNYRVTVTYELEAENPDEAVELVLIGEAPDPNILCELIDDPNE